MDMKNRIQLNTILIPAVLFGMMISASAQSINLWRGGETTADWSDPYKWKLKHVPVGEEFVQFRTPSAVVAVNSSVELNNGMMLYGQDLFLQGNGNINMWSPIEHQRTVNIPASSSGHANLTLSDNLSLNGRIALAAKSFGTSTSKGSITLKDRSAITGKLSIGNNGSGSGQVFVRDQSTYHIEELEFNTLAEKGGVAELHILGGTVHLDTKDSPFDTFLADPSRKIIIGDCGQLKINSAWAVPLKKNVISKMISEKRIVAAQGSELTPPTFHQDMILIQAKTVGNPHSLDTTLAESKQSTEIKPQSTPASATLADTAPVVLADTASESEPKPRGKTSRLDSLLQDVKIAELNADALAQSEGKADALESAPLASYIVFFSAVFFFLRPAKRKEEDPAPEEQAAND